MNFSKADSGIWQIGYTCSYARIDNFNFSQSLTGGKQKHPRKQGKPQGQHKSAKPQNSKNASNSEISTKRGPKKVQEQKVVDYSKFSINLRFSFFF